MGITSAVDVFLLCSGTSPLVHSMKGFGSPLASQCKFKSSPSSTSIVAFDRLVILGGTEEDRVTLDNIII